MIRSLLGSTALLGVILFNAQAKAEDSAKPITATPQLKISGMTSFNSFFFKNKRIYVQGNPANDPSKRNKYGRGQLFSIDNSRLKFAVDGTTDQGMEYGLVFVFDGNTNKDKIVREDYLYFGGTWGKIYAGDTYGVQNTMAFGGYDQWGGTGFIDGAVFDRVVNYTTGTLHSVDLEGDTSRDTKLTYLTPRWNGVQAGISYTPRTEHRGEQIIEAGRSVSSPKKPFDTDNIAGGVNFIHKFTNGFEMALSATSIFGKAHPEFKGAEARKNTASYAFGGTFSYKNVGFSAEYGNNGRSHEFKDLGRKTNAGQFLDFGLSYTCGATKFSAGYYYAWRRSLDANLTRKKSKTRAVAAAIDHKLAPGLGVYFEYAYFQMKNPAALDEAARINANLAAANEYIGGVRSNHANAFVVGSRLVF